MTISDEIGKVQGFRRCCSEPEIVEQDTFSEPMWCCCNCGTYHNTPVKKEETTICKHCKTVKLVSWKFCPECGANS